MNSPDKQPFEGSWRTRWHEIIFEAETPEGKLFDVVLLWAILLSVLAVLLESVPSVSAVYGPVLRAAEWIFTVLFTFEYIARVLTAKRPSQYIFSFFGVVDLLAVAPTYLSLFFAGTQYLLVIRAVRLLRVFRILKLVRFVSESRVLTTALYASRHKIAVFLGAVFTVVLIVGALMYLIEGPDHGFTSIPLSMYWAIVTMTTVGYGDVAPQTALGQALAALLMVVGYGVIAVPTGIVSVELANAQPEQLNSVACRSCSRGGQALDAAYCKYCGAKR